jgi:hypothetical protein
MLPIFMTEPIRVIRVIRGCPFLNSFCLTGIFDLQPVPPKEKNAPTTDNQRGSAATEELTTDHTDNTDIRMIYGTGQKWWRTVNNGRIQANRPSKHG